MSYEAFFFFLSWDFFFRNIRSFNVSLFVHFFFTFFEKLGLLFARRMYLSKSVEFTQRCLLLVRFFFFFFFFAHIGLEMTLRDVTRAKKRGENTCVTSTSS